MTGRQRRDAILHAATALTDPHGDAAGTDCGLAAVSAVTGLALPALRELAAGVGRPVRSLSAVDLAAVLSAVGVACRVAVPEVNPRDWVPAGDVLWYPAASTLAVVRLLPPHPPDPPHWVAVRGGLVADGIGRLTPAGDYWGLGKQADACAELVRLGGVDAGRGEFPTLRVARMVRRSVVGGGVVVRGTIERAASVPALCVDVGAAVGGRTAPGLCFRCALIATGRWRCRISTRCRRVGIVGRCSTGRGGAVRPSGDAAVMVADLPVVETDGCVVSVCEVARPDSAPVPVGPVAEIALPVGPVSVGPVPVGPAPVGTGRWSA